MAVEEVAVERGGAGPGGLGDQARLVQRHGPGVAVRGMCQYTIRGGKVQGRRPVYIRGRGYESRDDRWFKWWLVLAVAGAIFACLVAIVAGQVIAGLFSYIAAGGPTPTPAAEPASWGVGIHQLAGDPRPFGLRM